MKMPEEEPKQGAPEWVVTFGDMMSLLLCFFVLLLSFSTMETQKFKVVAGYIREAFGVQVKQRYTEIPAGDTVVSVEFNQPTYAKEIVFEQVIDKMRSFQYEAMIEAEMEDEGVRVRVDGGLVFTAGQADVLEDFQSFLASVAETIEETGSKAIVEGHTDNVPIQSARFPSNWELSASRAAAVVRFLESRGIAGSRLSAVGFGDTKPIADNSTAEGRKTNRRVEIMIVTGSGEE